jgi:OHCU decarboxylase
VAEAAWAHAPFAGLDALHEAMVAAVAAAPPERQLALIRAHPELAGREAAAGELTEASTREQASAGLHRLTAAELERWRELNHQYRERFGFPLVVCVREHTKDSILAWGQERLAHEPEAEVEIALAEIAKIARLRLEELER